jgi:type IV pilus assembly protein PilW
MNKNLNTQQGFSLVELMVVTIISLLLSYAVMEVYLAQTQIYKTSTSQDLIQNAENAITNLVTPVIRASGFVGCASVGTVVSNLNGGGSNPIGSLNTTPTMIAGYDNGATSINITQANSANDTNANTWTPVLDAELLGNVENTSDVMVVLGATLGSFPVAVTAITSGSNSFTVQSTTGLNLSVGQFAALSDCVKTSIFQVTDITGTTITHAAGSGPYGNSSDTFVMNYQTGTQFIPLQQTAFFVGQGQGGQSTLMRATLSSGIWTIQALVPGVDLMKIQYGIGNNGNVSQYVTAAAVTDWSKVYSVRLGFLIEGQTASGPKGATQYTVLGIPVTAPADNRLRHAYEITVNLRNAIS